MYFRVNLFITFLPLISFFFTPSNPFVLFRKPLTGKMRLSILAGYSFGPDTRFLTCFYANLRGMINEIDSVRCPGRG